VNKRSLILLALGLLAAPRGVLAQAVEFQNLAVRPAILCSGSPATVTFQAALPGNSTGSENLYLYGTIDSSATVSATSNVFLWSGTTFNAGTNTFTGSTTTLSPSYNATWYMAAPTFAGFSTYTAVITSIPAYANGTVVYITIGGADSYTSGYTEPFSIQIPVTVDCTKSDGINTGNGVFVNAGVTYTGASNPVTLQINNSCSSPTFTNTATATFTKTPTATFTNTFTPTISNTFTFTATNTVTKTYTPTFTNTFTSTLTNTFTNTFTNTYSPTFTNTYTKTPTPTYTNTVTATFTPTFTNTFVNTPTFTNTFTNTFTSTFTNTPTKTDTSTQTNTDTSTYTVTPTATPTNTFMNSPTFTNTLTNSPTQTNTNTFVNSPTNTNTFTNTPTMTNTNTLVNTPTVTNTFTNTPTPTFTNTLVNTATSTNTFTATNSYTVTNTPTNTNTRTPTLTFTSTLVNTATFTNTSTQTFTNTPTYTFTVTPTFTSFVAIGKTVSETQANAGDVLTYTIAITVTGNGLTNAVVTDVLPANMTFQAFGTMPVGTTINPSPLQWTLPSPLATGIYDLTYQTKVNAFAPANVPLTNNAQLTYAGLANPLKASVPVTVIGQFSVSVNIYNSAGEVVKTIPIQQFSTAINNIALSTTNMITTLTGPGSTIDILFNGYVIGTWNGTNNAGQPVSNGTYRVQVDNANAAGVVTSVSQNAIVSRSLSSVEVDIFNGAGEVVRKLYNVVANSTTSNMTNVILSSTVLQPNANNVQNPSTSSLLQILVQDSNAPVTLTWDGTNNLGTTVTPGQYQIEVHWTNGDGTTTDITRTIMVLTNTGVSGIVVAKPNILNATNGMTTTFNAAGVTNASGLKVKIYTIAGELVQAFVSGTPTAIWNASGLASGIYIANVEVDNANGGTINQERLKILVLH